MHKLPKSVVRGPGTKAMAKEQRASSRRSRQESPPTDKTTKDEKRPRSRSPFSEKSFSGSEKSMDATNTGNNSKGQATTSNTEQPRQTDTTLNNTDNRHKTDANNEELFNFMLKNFEPRFRTAKTVFEQLVKYVPRADIHEIVFTRNGIILKSRNPDLHRLIRNKATYEIFGKTATMEALSPRKARVPPPPRKPPMLSVVIKGVDPTWAEEEIYNELHSEGAPVEKCLRILCKDGPTYLVRILTPDQQLIDLLLEQGAYIYRKRHRVEPSNTKSPLPVRCERCQSYNEHTTAKCPNTPKCGYCSQDHATKSCPNGNQPPKCATCTEEHASYSAKCKAKPTANPTTPELVVPVRTPDPPVTNSNSLREPVTVEDMIRFFCLTLQNIHPFLRPHILQQLNYTTKLMYKLTVQATYSGPHVHFKINPLPNDNQDG